MIRYSQIDTAAKRIRDSALVAFPTETVYGLGGNACSDSAVASIYVAKDRPQFNPLITHVLNKEEAFAYARYIPEAERLMDTYWPGPLTIILPRLDDCKLSLLVSAGLDCVGLRAPNHPLAQELLRASGLPIAAPSANRSGRISPTTAEHVREELGDTCMILDGGACPIGIESTVVDMTSETPVILRHGSVMIPALVAGSDAEVKSPGQLASHYAPNAQMRLNALTTLPEEVLLGFGDVQGDMNLSARGDLKEAAANLFAMLRALDKRGAKTIAVAPIPMENIGIAINDRLSRAAASR